MSKQYPFKFLDAYTREDKEIFFGRKEEVDSLYEMVFQSDTLLVYGASGTGKTSLVQCGLAGRFETHDWLALPVRRGNNLNASLERVMNEAGGEWAEEEENETIDFQSPQLLLTRDIRAIYLRYFRPTYLIFDQFEELYILGSADEQAAFIETVKILLQVEQPLKMIFIIREEYLGHLFAFEKAVPQLLRKKLRVEPMNLDKVGQVLMGVNALPASNVKLEADAETEIVEAIFEKIKTREKSLTIQLPYLQVFLDKLYLSITHDEARQAKALIGPAALAAMGNIGDVLRQLLEEQALSIANELSGEFPGTGPETIWQVISPFATLEGTREPMSLAAMQVRLPELDPPMLNRAIALLVNRRLLRFDDVEEMYELAHDSLALQIAGRRGEEEIALLEAQRIIHSQTALKPEKREYFSEKQLNLLEPLITKLILSEEEKDWVEQSRAEALKIRVLHSNRVYLSVLFGLLLFFVTISIWKWSFEQVNDYKFLDREKYNNLLSEMDKLKEEKAKTKSKEFGDYYDRALRIFEAGGCPDSLIRGMEKISSEYSDSTRFGEVISQLQSKNPKCK